MLPPSLNLSDPALLVQTETSSSVTPALFNPVRWWDAASLNYLTNGAIISTNDPWDDKSVNDDDAVSTIGAEPTLQKEVINGNSTVRFVGTKHMVFEGGDLILGDFTILCVGLSASDSNYVSRAGFNRQVRINYLNQPRASWFVGNSGSELVSNQFLSNANLPRMIGHRRTSSPATFRFFDNATLVMPITGGVDGSLFGINQIGTLPNEFATPINMDIAELVIFDTALLDSEIQALYYQYFKPKFALP